jgi:hypothetical protein
MQQTLTRSEVFSKDSQDSPRTPHPPAIPLSCINYRQMFSEWEAMFLCAIVNSIRTVRRRSYRIYWCGSEEMIEQFGEDVFQRLVSRGAIQVWNHEGVLPAVTLTPWCAAVLGVRLSEYWVRHIVRVKEYRGVGRRLARIRIQRWDTEPYWTYRDRPERSIRIPGNTCELPLVGDPEDKSYNRDKQEYLEDWQTWTFTKNPRKALTITIRVGSFAHKIIINRDRSSHDTHSKSKKKSKHAARLQP